MTTSEVTPGVTPASATAPCAACGTPLAGDQRYCLNCGEPRAEAQRRMPAHPRGSIDAVDARVVPASHALREPTSLAAILAGLACLLVAMGVGVLIGRGSGDDAVPATVREAAAPAAAATSPATFAGDWPSGKEGWTVAVAVLAKATTTPAAVVAAKTAATGKGAATVGALDADAYPSLTGGSYVVYSGVFDSESAATDALKALTAKFPEARVVRVASAAAPPAASAKSTSKSGSAPRKSSTKQPAAADDTTSEFEKSKKAPKTVGTGGKPPPTDDKPAAGGGGFEDIG